MIVVSFLIDKGEVFSIHACKNCIQVLYIELSVMLSMFLVDIYSVFVVMLAYMYSCRSTFKLATT